MKLRLTCDFEFHSPDGSVSLVRAHKLLLLAVSPVFEAMFTTCFETIKLTS